MPLIKGVCLTFLVTALGKNPHGGHEQGGTRASRFHRITARAFMASGGEALRPYGRGENRPGASGCSAGRGFPGQQCSELTRLRERFLGDWPENSGSNEPCDCTLLLLEVAGSRWAPGGFEWARAGCRGMWAMKTWAGAPWGARGSNRSPFFLVAGKFCVE